MKKIALLTLIVFLLATGSGVASKNTISGNVYGYYETETIELSLERVLLGKASLVLGGQYLDDENYGALVGARYYLQGSPSNGLFAQGGARGYQIGGGEEDYYEGHVVGSLGYKYVLPFGLTLEAGGEGSYRVWDNAPDQLEDGEIETRLLINTGLSF
ncbi:MAG: hypothetical protein ACOYD6_04800 [Limnochordia bacterium]